MSGRAPPRILVVEDEGIISAHLQSSLRRLGYVIVGAVDSGEEALSLVASLAPDLVLMDIGLAGDLDGIATAAELLVRRGPPVVFLTSHSDPSTLARATATEPVGYVTKPFQEANLAATIEVGLQQSAVRRRLEASEIAARAAEERLRGIAARVPGVVYQYVMRADGSFGLLYASEAIRELAGIGIEEARADVNALFGAIHPEDLPALMAQTIASAEALTEFSIELRAARDRRWFLVRATPTRQPNGDVVWHGFATDVTDRRRVDAERRAIEKKLHLAQKHESLGVMAAGIAHNFNNLLTSVLGNIQLAAELAPAARAMLEDAAGSAERAAAISGVMLTYLGQSVSRRAPHDLAGQLADLIPILRPSLPADVQLETSLAPDTPEIMIDPSELRELVLSIVTNAAEAMPARGGTVRVATRRVRSDESPGERGERALLEITDDGAGMDAATLERVFDPFFSTKFTGRGLGLPTAQGITRALGGAIEVESEPGRGTSVRITFPVSQRADIAAEAPVAVLPTPSAAGARRAPRDGLILIVDDDSNVRQAIARMFKRLGREVLLAADGAEALGLVDTRADEIGAVLLDLSMPGEGGWKVLAAMRRRAPDHYIVIASGFDVAQLRDEDRALAPDAWLQKPFGLREVAELFAPR